MRKITYSEANSLDLVIMKKEAAFQDKFPMLYILQILTLAVTGWPLDDVDATQKEVQ